MCITCGCGDGAEVTVTDPQTGELRPIERAAHDHAHGHSHDHEHPHDHEHHDHRHPQDNDHDHSHGHDHSHDHGRHAHAHDHGHPHSHDDHHEHGEARLEVVALAGRHGVTVDIERAILDKNDQLAARNRAWFEGREVLALNLVSSPGAGKTSLLERTIRDLKGEIPIGVIEGDQQTQNDADRIKAAGAAAVQINTGTGCHLEADMVQRALDALRPPFGSVVMIENVGNLVCPALFDLGEAAKVVVLSVTEGDDKPLKYPHMFRAADLMIVSKIDLAPYVSFDAARCEAVAREVNPAIRSIRLSSQTGEGMEAWYDWLRAARLRRSAAAAVAAS